MEIRIYPSVNSYFNLGVAELCDEFFEVSRSKEPLIIVCIAPWSLKEVVFASWLKRWDKSRIIIVSDKRFFPLAKYFQRGNEDVVGICHPAELCSVFIEFLTKGKLNGEKLKDEIAHLTDREYFSLKSALKNISVHKQAVNMGVSTKTVFGHRASSARKLNVRKLSHLLSEKILYSDQSLIH